MDVALYRGRGADIVLVHASMQPPRAAEQRHGPLRYLDTVRVDGTVLADAWDVFAEQMETRFFALLDERDGLRLLRHRIGEPASPTGASAPAPAPATHS